jgi:hypothetical protein
MELNKSTTFSSMGGDVYHGIAIFFLTSRTSSPKLVLNNYECLEKIILGFISLSSPQVYEDNLRGLV